MWSLLNVKFQELNEVGDFEQAEEVANQALEAAEAEFGDSHVNVATSCSNLGLAAMNLGKFEHAETILRRAIEIAAQLEDSEGIDSLELIPLKSNLGRCLHLAGKLEDAQALFSLIVETLVEQSREIQQCFADEFAKAFGQLADIERMYGNIENTQQHYEDALAICREFEDVAVETVADIILSYITLLIGEHEIVYASDLNYEFGNYVKEIDFMPFQAKVLADRALISYRLCDSKTAISLAREALSLLETEPTADEELLKVSYYHLAEYYLSTNDAVAAKNAFEKFRALEDPLQAELHPDLHCQIDLYGQIFSKLGDHKTAVELQNRHVSICEQFFGGSNYHICLAITALAETYCTAGDYESAKHYADSAFKMAEGYRGKHSVETFPPHLALIQALVGNSENEAALRLANDLFEAMKRAFSSLDAVVGRGIYEQLEELIEVFQILGRNQLSADAFSLLERIQKPLIEARSLCEEGGAGALLSEQELAELNLEQHPEKASELLSQAQNLMTNWEIPQALSYFEHLIKFADDLDLESQYLALLGASDCYKEIGDADNAERLLKRALVVKEEQVGTLHPELVNHLLLIADFYQHIEKYDEAANRAETALSIVDELSEDNASSRADALFCLSGIRKQQLRFDEAEQLIQQAISEYEKAHGELHQMIARSLNDLAIIYEAQLRYNEAEQAYRRAIAMSERLEGTYSTTVAAMMENLATLYSLQGNKNKSDELAVRAIAIYEKVAPESERFAIALRERGIRLFELEDFQESSRLAEQALDVANRSPGCNPQVIRHILEDLVIVSRELGASGRAAQYEAALVQLSADEVEADLGN